MKLHLQNRYNNKEYLLSIDALFVASSPQIFQFNIIMPQDADFGEYNYSIYPDDCCTPFETGLLKYRPDTRVVPIEYHKEITYEVYEG